MTSATRSDWLIPAGLIALSIIPIAGGTFRLVQLGGGAELTPDSARFVAAPLSVVWHIVSSVIFCVLGAFQFAPGFRRRHPNWHRAAGRVLVPCGLVTALTGLWMTVFYPLPPALQGNLLWGFRILIGTTMMFGISWGLFKILRRDYASHGAWMIRSYAIGQGAGTQVLTVLPWALFFGMPGGLTRDLLMIAGWIINLAVAEWIIRR